MDQGAVRFPAPNPCQHILSVFDTKEELLAYVDAKDLEADLVGHLSSNKFDEAYECASKARERLIACSEEWRSKAASLTMPLRRFTAFAVLMRCIAHGAGVLERQKKYATAISWQRFLLKTPELKPFCANARGAWWDRLALNLDAHMKEREEALLEIKEGMEDEAVADKDKLMLQDRAIKISKGDFLERIILMEPVKNCISELKPFCANARGAWWDRLALNLDAHMKEREEALLEIKEGMEDEAVADKDKLMLQDRAIKISKGDFLERIVLMEPVKKEISGATLSKELGDSRINRFVLQGDDGIVAECSVEEVVRKHYILKEGFDNGVHAEGSIWHTVLGLLFYDIIFDHSIEGVWLSELQANPIDLNSRSLYENRKERFDERFSWLETAGDDEIEDVVRSTWTAQNLLETSEISWELFQNVEDFLEFLFCCPRSGMLAVLRRVVTDYRNCRSGFPDLTVWNTKKKKVAVVEVKGPGDRLSTKQRLWLDYFMRNGIRAEVCHVIAKGTLR
ncbi:VRR-NUC domain protein [Oesophagostomum dentatum]|uniref:Fanconi-associated nuclease n=1 Tax=Oesophagostomum dentatum TaxID=61180 RepID=A0A0B1TKA5_OESDE|nr:VRR-NUC domain protein [Oesophagostomum dentatum]